MINESNVVKPEKFGPLHFVHHFTVPLIIDTCISQIFLTTLLFNCFLVKTVY